MSIGSQIKKLRKERKLSQEQLAKKCGLSRNSIYNYENEKRSPNSKDLHEIANALNVPTYELIPIKEQTYTLGYDTNTISKLIKEAEKNNDPYHDLRREADLLDIADRFYDSIKPKIFEYFLECNQIIDGTEKIKPEDLKAIEDKIISYAKFLVHNAIKEGE